MGTKALVSPPDVPLGKIKCFGSFGAKYEVGKPLRLLKNGDWMVSIKLVDTGEDVEYSYARLLNDPEAR